MSSQPTSIVTVTLNPTIDRIIEVPSFRVGGHQQGVLRVREPAGKAINVSRALSELGVRNTAIGWVGMNAFDLFHETLQSTGIKACFLPITGHTRENITIIDPHSHAETHIRDAGPRVDHADVRRLTDLINSVVNDSSLVIFTGSLPPGLSLEAWDDLIKACLSRGARVAIDTAGKPLERAIEHAVWLVKPNESELGELYNQTLSDEPSLLEAARRLAEGVPVVVVTAGRRGAYCLNEGRVWHAQATVSQQAIRSTVGCGDAMMAGLLFGLLGDDGGFEAALREGVAVSAAATLTEQPGRFDRCALDSIRQSVKVRELT